MAGIDISDLGSGEDGAGMTAVSRAEVSQAQVGCAGHSLCMMHSERETKSKSHGLQFKAEGQEALTVR